MIAVALIGVKQRVKERMGPLWWYAALQFFFSKLGDVINLYVGAFLIPAVVLPADLGAITPLKMLMAFALFPMVLLSGVAVKFVNAFHVGDQKPLVKGILRDLSAVAAMLSVAVVLVLWVGQDFALARLKLSDSRVIWALSAAVVLACWQSVPGSAVQGLMRFRHMILSGMAGPLVYLGLVLLLLRPLQLLGYMIALMGMSLAGALYLGWAVREYIRPGIVPASYRGHWAEIKRYVINAGALALFAGLAAVIEPWTIRNFTPPMDSAGYYIAFMFGQIPLYLSGALIPFLFSLVSDRHERGQQTRFLLGQSVAVMLAVGVPLAMLFALFGGRLLDLRPSWSQYAAYAPLLWKVSIVSTLQGIALAYASHESACYRFGYVKFFVPVLAVEMLVLYGCMGWGFFHPRMSPSVWQTVDELIGPKLDFAVWVMMGTKAVLVLPVIWGFAGSPYAKSVPVSKRP